MNELGTLAILNGDRCRGVKYGLVSLYCSQGFDAAIDRGLFTNCLRGWFVRDMSAVCGDVKTEGRMKG